MVHGVALYRGAEPSKSARAKAMTRAARSAIADVVVTSLSANDVVVANGTAVGSVLSLGERVLVDIAGVGERVATVTAIDQPGYRLAFGSPLSAAEVVLARRFDGALADDPRPSRDEAAATLDRLVPPYPEPVVGRYPGVVRVLLAVGLAAGAWAAAIGMVRLLQH